MSETNMTVLEAATEITAAAIQTVENGLTFTNPDLVCNFFTKVYEAVRKCEFRE